LVIRCEACSTLYELEETLLSPSGSQVQCTKCQHVFTAFPTRAAGRTLVGVPPTPAPAPEAGRARSATPRPAAAARPEAARAARSGPPAIYRPPSPPPGPAAPTAARAPVLRRDTVGTFEARLRRHARARWAIPAAAALLIAGVAVAWRLLALPADSDAERVRGEARALLARDDGASVERAAALLDGTLRRSRSTEGAAERALAELLRGAAAADEGEALLARRAAKEAERERLRRDQPEGWQEAERTVIAEAQALEGEVHAREERARTLSASALETLRSLRREVGDVPEVARGLALAQAARGDRDAARKLARAAGAGRAADPWLALAEGWADAREPDRAARERAVVRLTALAASNPELLRGRYLLARTQVALGRRDEALAVVERLLAANPSHEGARRLRADLAASTEPAPIMAGVAAAPAPAATPAPAAPAPVAEPRPVENTQPQTRKPLSQPAAAPPNAGTRPALAPATVERAPVPPAAIPEAPLPAAVPALPAAEADPAGGEAGELPAPKPPERPTRLRDELLPPANGG
jgi:predicted Zn finger-like uncharacterized protein